MFDVEELGVDRVMEIALEIAWKNVDAVYLSFDIDVVDPGYAPGTGTPEPGGMSPREASRRCGWWRRRAWSAWTSSIAPPYDVADTTSQLGARVVMDTLATLVENGHLGTRLTAEDRARAEQERHHAAGLGDTSAPAIGDRHRPKR